MTVPPARRNMGELVLCPEGERLYNYVNNCLDDDELCFTQAHKDAFDKWIEHKNNCDKCGYV